MLRRPSDRPFSRNLALIRRAAAAVLATIFSIGVSSCSDDGLTEPDPELEGLAASVAEYLDATQPDDLPGVSVLIRRDGEVVVNQSRGIARLQGEVPITQHTGFRTASVTKPMTALALMQLVEEGRVSLDDSLLTHVPELPTSYEAITLAHLLSHRSGLLDYIDDTQVRARLDGLRTSDFISAIPSLGLQNLQFQPGAFGDYSNTGYVFLALVIERVTGVSYPEYMANRIFDLVGMDDTYVISEDRHMGDHGEEFALSFGATREVLGFNSLIYGANGIVSTVHDLNLFVEALLSGNIVTDSTLAEMTVSRGSLPGIGDYGYGWLIGTGGYRHTGGFDGYRTLLSINAVRDLQVIILTNNGGTGEQQMLDLLQIARDHPDEVDSGP